MLISSSGYLAIHSGDVIMFVINQVLDRLIYAILPRLFESATRISIEIVN